MNFKRKEKSKCIYAKQKFNLVKHNISFDKSGDMIHKICELENTYMIVDIMENDDVIFNDIMYDEENYEFLYNSMIIDNTDYYEGSLYIETEEKYSKKNEYSYNNMDIYGYDDNFDAYLLEDVD